MFLFLIPPLLIVFLLSLLFAGMKGRAAAKIKWSISLVVAYLIYLVIAFAIAKNDINDTQDTQILIGGLLALVGGIAGFILDKIGKLCIDFVAVYVMPDNRD